MHGSGRQRAPVAPAPSHSVVCLPDPAPLHGREQDAHFVTAGGGRPSTTRPAWTGCGRRHGGRRPARPGSRPRSKRSCVRCDECIRGGVPGGSRSSSAGPGRKRRRGPRCTGSWNATGWSWDDPVPPISTLLACNRSAIGAVMVLADAWRSSGVCGDRLRCPVVPESRPSRWKASRGRIQRRT